MLGAAASSCYFLFFSFSVIYGKKIHHDMVLCHEILHSSEAYPVQLFEYSPERSDITLCIKELDRHLIEYNTLVIG